MKLSVSTEEHQQEVPGTAGIFRAAETRRVWIVHLQLEISEEERVIATKCQIWDKVFFSAAADPEDYDDSSPAAAMVSRIGFSSDLDALVKGCGSTFHNLYDAKEFEIKFVQTAMPKLKAMLDVAGRPDTGTRTYEF